MKMFVQVRLYKRLVKVFRSSFRPVTLTVCLSMQIPRERKNTKIDEEESMQKIVLYT